MERGDFVYFSSNTHHNILYPGVTFNLYIRIDQYKTKGFHNSFDFKYNCNKLIYFEYYSSIKEATCRENYIKNLEKRMKK
jgi:putative endonuclease